MDDDSHAFSLLGAEAPADFNDWRARIRPWERHPVDPREMEIPDDIDEEVDLFLEQEKFRREREERKEKISRTDSCPENKSRGGGGNPTAWK